MSELELGKRLDNKHGSRFSLDKQSFNPEP